MDYWGLANKKALNTILVHDPGEIFIHPDSQFATLDASILMLDTRDRKRIHILTTPEGANYIFTNYRGSVDTNIYKRYPEFIKLYEIQIDNNNITTILKIKSNEK